MKKIISDIFKRTTSTRFTELDGIRAIAIIFVLIFHGFLIVRDTLQTEIQCINFVNNLPWWLKWTLSGHYGVDIFMVLSGFLITTALLKEYSENKKINLKWFYIKRILRIYPVYVIFLLFLLLFDFSKLKHVILSLFALNNILYSPSMLDINWLIAIELQFYLIAPFLVIFLAKSKKPFLWIGVFFLISFLWRSYFIVKKPELYSNTILEIIVSKNYEIMNYYWRNIYVAFQSRFPAILCGISSALLIFKYKTVIMELFKSKLRTIILTLFLITAFFIIFTFNIEWNSEVDFSNKIIKLSYVISLIFNSFIISLITSLIMILMYGNCDKNNILNVLLSSPVLYPIAKVSYSIYLFHLAGLYVFRVIIFGNNRINYVFWGDVILNIIFAGIFAFLFGIFIYIVVEYSFLNGKIYNYFKEKFT